MRPSCCRCAPNGTIAYAVYSPLCGGWLTGKYGRGRPYPAGSRMTQRPEPYAELASEATFAKLDVLGQFARERGVSMAAVALAWLLGDERIAQIVIGPGRPEHLQPVADAIEHPLSADERARLGEAVRMSDVLVLSHADVHAALAPDDVRARDRRGADRAVHRGGVRAAAQRDDPARRARVHGFDAGVRGRRSAKDVRAQGDLPDARRTRAAGSTPTRAW